MLDLTAIKKTIDDYQNDDEYTNVGKLNLAAWLGERAHLLVAEIEELRQVLEETVDCLEDVSSGKDGWAWEEVLQQARALLTVMGEEDE